MIFLLYKNNNNNNNNNKLNQTPLKLEMGIFFSLYWGLTKRKPLWVILCRLPEKGRKEIEDIVKEMKERDREERETGMKVKKQKK